MTAAGDYHLQVLAIDLAGNSALLALAFELRPGLPAAAYALCSATTTRVFNNARVGSATPGGVASVASNGAIVIENHARVDGDLVAGRG